MAHFARVEDGVVQEVIVVNNDDCGGGEFPDSEKVGQEFLSSLGLEGVFFQTSYNGNFRYNYAGIGHTFAPEYGEHGAFIPPKPYNSWLLGEDCNWNAPVPYPDDGRGYYWSERDQEWVWLNQNIDPSITELSNKESN